jgi:hypothetical protein
VNPRQVQLGQGRQRSAAGSESGAGRVEQSGAERLQQTGAAVSAGTAPDPEHDLVAASVERGQHGLTHSTRRGGQRRQLPAGQPHQAARVGHLDDGHRPSARVRRRHGLAGRPGHRDGHPLEPGRDRGVEGAVAAVGDGQDHQLHVATL